jgi:hypothetical protein
VGIPELARPYAGLRKTIVESKLELLTSIHRTSVNQQGMHSAFITTEQSLPNAFNTPLADAADVMLFEFDEHTPLFFEGMYEK